MNTKEKTCAERVNNAFKSRMDDIRALYNAEGQTLPDIGSLNEYGLSIDYVEAGTFEGQRTPYYRYQLSWGGPSEEFRVYLNGEVEFWFLDWGDSASVDVTGDDRDIIHDIIDPIVGYNGNPPII